MRRSGTSRWLRRTALAWLSTLVTAAYAQLGGAPPVRLVDIVEVLEHEDQVDITIQFNCSVRYITHLPASEGTTVRVQMQPLPDCGIVPGNPIASEIPPLSGGSGVLSAVRVEGDVPGQITLVFDFKKSERFVLAQGVDPRGLRMRLIDRARGRPKILLTQPTDTVSNFAINLDAQTRPFDQDAITRAHEKFQAPVYTSEETVEGQKWYRLRVGPIERRSEADRLLNLALPDYPRAWLAIGDDAVTSSPDMESAEALPGVERIASDPPLAPGVIATQLAQARAALSGHDYNTAIRLLTQLQRQPEFPERAHAQELLGLARERAGQLAHAKAEYEEYLRRYPHGDAAERIAVRLRILRAASLKAATGESAAENNSRWRLDGGFSQLFRYDGTRVDNSATLATTPGSTILPSSLQTTTQNTLFNDADLLLRRHGDEIDWLGRVSAGYSKSFARDSVGDERRISIASVELVDRTLGILARLGRQTRNQDGVLGTFDGLFLSYQWRPSWGVNVTAGYPVEQTTSGFQSGRQFETVALAYTPVGSRWDASIFAANQQFDGIRDRRAIGFEGRLLAKWASLIAVLDYDPSYHSVNTASLLGTVQLPMRWALSFDAERRNSPVLTTRNALIGQPVTTLAQLEQVFTLQEIFQLARDRTPVTTDYSITATRPLGERFQFATTVSATETAATVTSGGVDADPATGLELTYQAQIYSSSLWRPGDFNVITATYSNTQIGTLVGVGASSRFPLTSAWRIGPRLTIDKRNLSSDASSELTYIPSMLLDYQRGRKLLQFEIGGQLGKRDAQLQSQNTKRYYISLSYRIGL
ncbi:MAG: SPOR domain-containing protein [Proteobacteria bacterium]|nr:SPOR domain-containing protein [Pseudomonadota bacterium]